MNVIVHLISLPWAPVLQPSVALGSLSAYLSKYFKNHVKCHSYSAFIEVLVDALGYDFIEFSDPKYLGRSAETISQVVYFEEFKRKNLNLKDHEQFIKNIRAENPLFSRKIAKKLRSALTKYIEYRIVPNLKKNCVNLVGMSMCMHQSYFSAFVGKYLKNNYPDYYYVFLYGGGSAESLSVAKVFADENIPGFMVMGEGESKLTSIIDTIQRSSSWSNKTEESISQNTVGVLPISQGILQYEKNENYFKDQLEMDSLPAPDYREYFDTLKRICKDYDTYNEFMKMVDIPIENTRGCFGKCDFCNNSIVWSGFRRRSNKSLARDAMSYTTKYNCNRVFFVDNVCNTWAPSYADQLVSINCKISSTMELRAQPSERFWTKLALSGLKVALTGVEALSPPLLKAIGKGTTVADNILTQKYLKELKVRFVANLMADHPCSTLDDVEYTKNVVDQLAHLDPFTITYYSLVQGSPHYNKLATSERRKLKIGHIVKASGIHKKLYISEYFQYPKTWLSAEVKSAWTDFARWYEARKKELLDQAENINIIECSDEALWIRRISKGKQEDYKYGPKYAHIYKVCHHGRTIKQICEKLNTSESEVNDILWEFTSQRLMIKIEDLFISLALRARDVLLKEYNLGGDS